MNFTARHLRRMAAGVLAACSVLVSPMAHAENHALIMWIGDYGGRADLPGIDLDGANAKRIAAAMGVPARNIVEVSNQAITLAGVSNALASLTNRIGRDDKVFIYYSGHGSQIDGSKYGSKCAEAMVTREPGLFLDIQLRDALDKLGAKASQVVMMNDSCFSGGAATATKSLPVDGDMVPKYFPGDIKLGGATAVSNDYQCGDPVNKMSRNLEAVGARPGGPQVLYIAASSAEEVSYATRQGSVATLAWAACIRGADTDRSGSINGEELVNCAQRFIDSRGGKRQTITVEGNRGLPLIFGAAGTGDGSPSPIRADRALEDIRNAADSGISVSLTAAKDTLRIKEDLLDFTVSTNRDGYLYVLHVGSDGKTFDLLFPNKHDQNNAISAGNHRFPKDSWRVRAGGPAGVSYLLAVVSPTRRDFGKNMDVSSIFPSVAVTAGNTKNLLAEATGANGGSGRFGASAVVAVRESN